MAVFSIYSCLIFFFIFAPTFEFTQIEKKVKHRVALLEKKWCFYEMHKKGFSRNLFPLLLSYIYFIKVFVVEDWNKQGNQHLPSPVKKQVLPQCTYTIMVPFFS